MHILPLRAKGKTLDFLCKQLFSGTDLDFSIAAPYVLVFLTQYTKMESGDGGRWADTEISFAVPASYKIRARPDEGEIPVVLPLIEFVNDEWNAITDREIYGRFDLQSSIKVCDPRLTDNLSLGEAEDLWFYVESPLMAGADEEVLQQSSPLFGVTKTAASAGPPKSNGSPEWAGLKKWLDAMGLSPETVAKEIPFRSIALKQFRDAADPVKSACYRKLVEVGRSFENRASGSYIREKFKVDLAFYVQEYVAPPITLGTTLGLIDCLAKGYWPFPEDGDGSKAARKTKEAIGEDRVNSRTKVGATAQQGDRYQMPIENPIWLQGTFIARERVVEIDISADYSSSSRSRDTR
jgi:hypothetical protein